MKKLFSLLLGSVFVLALALPAFAQDPSGPPTKEPPAPSTRNMDKLKARKEGASDNQGGKKAKLRKEGNEQKLILRKEGVRPMRAHR